MHCIRCAAVHECTCLTLSLRALMYTLALRALVHHLSACDLCITPWFHKSGADLGQRPVVRAHSCACAQFTDKWYLWCMPSICQTRMHTRSTAAASLSCVEAEVPAICAKLMPNICCAFVQGYSRLMVLLMCARLRVHLSLWNFLAFVPQRVRCQCLLTMLMIYYRPQMLRVPSSWTSLSQRCRKPPPCQAGLC